jgi:hypothetical protein
MEKKKLNNRLPINDVNILGYYGIKKGKDFRKQVTRKKDPHPLTSNKYPLQRKSETQIVLCPVVVELVVDGGSVVVTVTTTRVVATSSVGVTVGVAVVVETIDEVTGFRA